MGDDARSRGGYRHVGCCVDESDAALAAFEEAARIWRLGEGRLSVVHALREPGGYTGGRAIWSPRPEQEATGLEDAGREWLHALAARHQGAQPVMLPPAGEPAQELLAWAAREGCDLLVAAPRRGPAARVAFLGSFASRLVRDAHCPVLLVGRRAGASM